MHLSAAGVVSAKSYEEGNPVNAAVFFVLIAAGIYILSRRDIDWERFLGKNKLIWLYLLYCLISVLWADFAFVCFKRWLKELGNVVMILVVLTEERPYEALGVLLKRLGYLWLPLSVLFIKYFPALGRGYTEQGEQMLTGIAMQKNQLGAMCLISLVYYGWHFIVCRRAEQSSFGQPLSRNPVYFPGFKFWSTENLVDMVLVIIALWLLHLSHSSTSLGCAAIATAILAASRQMSRKPDRIIGWSVFAVLLYLGLNEAMDLNRFIIHMLGRKENLTGRAEIWAILEKMAVNPWIGAGYQGFWLGDRLKEIWEKAGGDIIQAHDGYLEQYLELGYIGVGFIIAIMLSGLVKIRSLFHRDNTAGVLMLCFLVIAVLYNYTEASFYAISNIWFLAVLAVTEAPSRQWLEGSERGIVITTAMPKANQTGR